MLRKTMLHKALLGSALTIVAVGVGWCGGEKNGNDLLPGFPNIACDARLFETGGHFKIVKTGSVIGKDQRRAVIYWVLESRADMLEFEEVRTAWGVRPSDSDFRGPRILFKDADKVMIEDAVLILQGFHRGLKKGDGVRAFIEVPRDVITGTRSAAIVQ
jgi:hypothetical protein